MSSLNILLVGAGALGLRYLEALSKNPKIENIFIVDIDENACMRAEEFWRESSINKRSKIKSYKNYTNIESSFELAIISTTAYARPVIIKDLMSSKSITIRSWLLEKLLSTDRESLEIFHNLYEKNKNVWVNTPRRVMSLYRQLRDKSEMNIKKFVVNGGNWGLACNSIHFLDLVEWLSKSIISTISLRNAKWCLSKRANYFDLTGTIYGELENRCSFIFNSEDEISPLKLEIYDDENIWNINETTGTITQNGKCIYEDRLEYLSEYAQNVTTEIIDYQTSTLPSLDISIEQHDKLLGALQDSWKNDFKNPKKMMVT